MSTPVPLPIERQLRWPALCTECCGPLLACLALLFVILYPLMLLGTIPNPVLDNDIYFNDDDTSCTSMSNYYAMHWWLILKGLIFVLAVSVAIAVPVTLMFIIFHLIQCGIEICTGTKPCCTEQTKLDCKKGCIECFSPYETIA